MAKRRKRSRPKRQSAAPKPAAERDRPARVRVSDAVWADFRAAAGMTPLSVRLGELVTRDVERYRSRRLRQGQLDDAELIEALERARELHADHAALVDRLERRLERAEARRSESCESVRFDRG
jgi:hypothetical protein